MRKITIILAILFTYTLGNLNGQVAVTNDGSMPNNSAMLDVKSTNKGVLVPRMTAAERDAITSPANALLVFVTDDDQFYYNAGDATTPNWTAIGGTGTDNDWTIDGNNMYSTVSGNVGIGTTNPSQKLSVRDGNIHVASEGSDSYIYLGSDELANAIGSYIWTDDNSGFAVGSTQGIPQFVVDNASGNVGIGTSSPGAELEVAGQIKLTGGTPGNGKVLTSDASGLGSWQNIPTGVQEIDDLSDAKTDSYSLFLGNNSGSNDDGSNYNTSIGAQSLRDNTSGQRNAALGTYSLYENTSGSRNTALGYAAMYKNEIGFSNVAVGVRTLYRGVGNHNIVAVGDSALFNNAYGATISSQGAENTAVGSKALYANTLGNQNTAIGIESLKTNTTGQSNTAVGAYTLDSNISGTGNTAMGIFSLTNNTGADHNSAFGQKSSYNITTGGYNSSFGSNSLYSEISGDHNSAFGYGSLFLHENGNKNTAIGYKALYNNDDGNENTAIGSQAGYNNSGSGNVFIGNKAGYNSILSNKLFIDNTDTDNPLIYGDFYSNEVGINGFLGVNMQNPLYNLHVNGNTKINEFLIVGEDVEVGTDVIAGEDVTAGGDVVTAGDFKYSAGKACLMNIPAASFGLSTNQDADKMAFDQSSGSWGIVNEDGNGSYSIQAGVYLPQGSNISKFSIWVLNSGESITVTLRRKPMGGGYYSDLAQIVVNSDIGKFEDNTINDPQIDNNDQFYYITAQFSGHGHLDFGEFYGAEIEYTISKVTPQ